MASKIYTKTGDLGKTSLIGGTKVAKSHIRIETYGTVDELNSYIGLAGDYMTDVHSKAVLKEIQDRLFTIGSSLACDPDKEPKMKIPDLKESDIVLLEKEIDKMSDAIPAMKFTPLGKAEAPGGATCPGRRQLGRWFRGRRPRLGRGRRADWLHHRLGGGLWRRALHGDSGWPLRTSAVSGKISSGRTTQHSPSAA